MRERPILFSGAMVRAILEGRKTQTRRVCKAGERMLKLLDESPYGVQGDRLWVRESWADGDFAVASFKGIVYRADQVFATALDGIKWRPSIHMPRWASRITLEVTGVRVERLHHITEADAIAEGMPSGPSVSARAIFEDLWEDLNAARGYGWDANPWVWVVEFRRLP